jgi:hypothetical protein
MSEAAAGTIRLQRPASIRMKRVGDHWQPKERRGPSDQQADGDFDTAAPTQAALDQGLAAGCGWPVRPLAGCLVWAPAVVLGATRCGVCCLSFVKRLVA